MEHYAMRNDIVRTALFVLLLAVATVLGLLAGGVVLFCEWAAS